MRKRARFRIIKNFQSGLGRTQNGFKTETPFVQLARRLVVDLSTTNLYG